MMEIDKKRIVHDLTITLDGGEKKGMSKSKGGREDFGLNGEKWKKTVFDLRM